MAFRFKANESVPENVRRIVGEEIASAAALLENAPPRNHDSAVHEARKSIKKIRGVLRLLRPELGKIYKREDRTFRDLGRGLSVLRDAAALLETVSHIEKQHPKAMRPQVVAGVRRGLQQEKRRLEQQFRKSGALPRAAADLQTAAKRIDQWPLEKKRFPAIAPGLKRTYRAGRRALKIAQKESDSVLYHSLRKRVKDHWYHIRLLENLWTEVMRAHEASLKKLETWLGEDHNISVLREKLEQHPQNYGGQQNVSVLCALAADYQVELQQKAIALARLVYAEKPGGFVDHLNSLWHSWQTQPEGREAARKGLPAKAKAPAA